MLNFVRRGSIQVVSELTIGLKRLKPELREYSEMGFFAG